MNKFKEWTIMKMETSKLFQIITIPILIIPALILCWMARRDSRKRREESHRIHQGYMGNGESQGELG